MAKKNKNKPIRIIGYACKWGIAYAQDQRPSGVLKKGAFNESLKKLRKEVPILWMHDEKRPIGRLENFKDEEVGLLIEASIYDHEAIRHIKGGGTRQFSPCFSSSKMEYDYTFGIELIAKALLWEVSVCSMGAGANVGFQIINGEK